MGSAAALGVRLSIAGRHDRRVVARPDQARTRWKDDFRGARSVVKVSINTVTFNSEADIAACLDSIGAQTFRDFRIRVFDNASRDGTLEVTAAYDVDLVKSRRIRDFRRRTMT